MAAMIYMRGKKKKNFNESFPIGKFKKWGEDFNKPWFTTELRKQLKTE